MGCVCLIFSSGLNWRRLFWLGLSFSLLMVLFRWEKYLSHEPQKCHSD